MEKRIRDRVWALIEESWAMQNPDSNGQTFDHFRRSQSEGWMTSAHNAVQLICPVESSAYRRKADKFAAKDWGYMAHEGVASMAAVLTNLLRDVDAGCLSAIADQAAAEAFADFLDHAKAYLAKNRKNESGAIAGVAFEDTLRRLCRRNGLVDKDVQLDSLISQLTAKDVLTQAKAKRARAAAHVRTKATHAQWDEFDLHDVSSTIEFTRELLDQHLAA
jgi:hypothetical protein